MKKIIALLLAVAMLAGLCGAFAEEAEKETIYYDDSLSFAMLYPDGYKADTIVENGVMLTSIESEDPTKPSFLMLVAPDNERENVARLNDLSDEEIEAFAADMTEDLNNPSWEIQETGLGSKLVVIDEQDADMDVVILASIYQGYLLVTYITLPDGSEVSAEDIATGIQIYTDMDFVTGAE